MKRKIFWITIFVILYLMTLMAVAVLQEANATDTDTEDWLVIEPPERICGEDWLCIPGCVCNRCVDEEEDNEVLEDDNRAVEHEHYQFCAEDFEDKGNLLHIDYFMKQPTAAVAVIAFVGRSRDLAKHVFVYNNISFGLDETAEQYYAAILQAHSEIGFAENEYPPSGLNLEQAKEIFYINDDEEARFWLSEERNNLTGRLYFYTLFGMFHNKLHPEDAGSAIAVMKDAGRNTSESIIKIDPLAYQLATIGYFNNMSIFDNMTVKDQCIFTDEDLPTDQLKAVEMILEKANQPESLPSPEPEPTPRHKYDYWRYKP